MIKNSSIKVKIQQSNWLRSILPASVKSLIRRGIPYADIRSVQLRSIAETRFGGCITDSFSPDSRIPFKIGIISDAAYAFANHVAACMEMEIRFQVIDIMADDWVRRIEESECHGFMAVPSTLLGAWRRLYEERLWAVKEYLGKVLCPTYDELYIWESKRRMHDWLVSHKIPHPETHVFTVRHEAEAFVKDTEYPLICKTDSGAAASGIFLLKNPIDARRLVRKAFNRGILGRYSDSRDREHSSILLQRYVPHDYEWRIVRIGNDYLCRRKTRVGNFASGSGDIDWAEPLPGMLEFVRQVTDAGRFRCMSLDLFENPDRERGQKFLVNELQSIIGFKDVPESVHTGRWFWDPVQKYWNFEHGTFHHNACANLRVRLLLENLGTLDTNTPSAGQSIF